MHSIIIRPPAKKTWLCLCISMQISMQRKPRATVKAVYDLVENDLKASLDMLPPTPEFNYHPSQAGVNGLLAKMYLYQGKYELAKQKAEAALEVYNFLYNFKDYDFIPGLPKFLGLAGFPSRAIDNKEGLWHKQASNPFVYMIACYMTDEHRALYAAKDRRLYFTLIEDAPFGNNLHGLNIMPKERYFKGGVYTLGALPDPRRMQCQAQSTWPRHRRCEQAPRKQVPARRLRSHRSQ